MSTPAADTVSVGDPIAIAGVDLSAEQPSDADLLTLDMMDKLSAYFKATLANSTEDYLLLAELNTLAASRYSSMTERTSAYLSFIQRVQTTRTYIELRGPPCEQLCLPTHVTHLCLECVECL